MLAVNINLSAATQLKAAAANMNEATEAGLDAAGEELHKVTLSRVEEIYKRPIPKSGKGRDLWKRRGRLKRSIKMRKTARSRFIEARGRANDYHPRREGLGLRWMPKNPADGVIRKNPYMHEGRDIGEPKAQRIFEQKFREKLNL